MKSISAKALAAGAVGAALSAVILLMAWYLPVFGIFAVLIAGLPSVYLSVRHGKKIALLSAVVAMPVLFAVSGNLLSTLFSAVVYLLPGLAIGFAIEKRKSYPIILASAGIAVMLGLLLELFWINQSGGGNGIEAIISGTTEQAKAAMQAILSQIPNTNELPVGDWNATVNQVMDAAKNMLLLYLPTIVICIAGAVAYGTVAFAVFMLSRLRVLSVPYLPFSQIRASKGLCIFSVILYFVVLFISDEGVLAAALQNMSAVTDAFLAICGLSLIDAKLSGKITSGYVRALIYAAAFLIGYVLIGLLTQGLILLGLLDGMIRFPRNPKAGEEHERSNQ